MRRILVIGGTGYVGTNLLRALSDSGHMVTTLSRQPRRSPLADEFEGRGIAALEGDITKPDTLAGVADGVDTVFHLASVAAGSPDTMDETNVQGTANVVAECAGKVERIVYASTTSVYGDAGDAIVSEADRPHPNTVYAHTKLSAERLVLGEADGNCGIVLRFGSVYGPNAPVVVDFLAKDGDVRVIGKGKNFANIIHVDDAVACLMAAGDRGRGGEVYIATDGTPIMPISFYGEMSQRLGRGKPRFVGTTKLRVLSSIFTFFGKVTGMPPIISTDTIRLLTNSIKVSNRKLIEELRVSLRYEDYVGGLEATFDALAAQLADGRKG